MMNTLGQEVQIGLILGDSHREMGCLPTEVRRSQPSIALNSLSAMDGFDHPLKN